MQTTKEKNKNKADFLVYTAQSAAEMPNVETV